jgi:uncharacterized protein YbaR (Trm112 family)
MLDILACPIDKYYPLELIEIDTVEDKTIDENVIKEGVLFCSLLLKKFQLCYQTNSEIKKRIFSFYKSGMKKFPAKS